MFKRIKVALGVMGMLLVAFTLAFGREINERLMSFIGDLNWLFGLVFAIAGVALFALLFWGQRHDKKYGDLAKSK